MGERGGAFSPGNIGKAWRGGRTGAIRLVCSVVTYVMITYCRFVLRENGKLTVAGMSVAQSP